MIDSTTLLPHYGGASRRGARRMVAEFNVPRWDPGRPMRSYLGVPRSATRSAFSVRRRQTWCDHLSVLSRETILSGHHRGLSERIQRRLNERPRWPSYATRASARAGPRIAVSAVVGEVPRRTIAVSAELARMWPRATSRLTLPRGLRRTLSIPEHECRPAGGRRLSHGSPCSGSALIRRAAK